MELDPAANLPIGSASRGDPAGRQNPTKESTRVMAVHIRLARYGTKKAPFYRVVVSDIRSPRDGRFIEALGTFDPRIEPPVIRLNQARVEHWQRVGAKPTATVARVIKTAAKQAAAAS